MLSFHGKQEIKDKYLARVIAHRKADAIIQGIGWENGKGCAVGCTLENYDHSRYPIELGLPKWLARLKDWIFENLPKEHAIEWPEKFLSIIPVGVCVEKVRYKLAVARMGSLIDLQNKNLANNPDLKIIINEVINSLKLVKICHEAAIDNWSADSAAEPERLAALSAADLAYSAAQSAARSAESAAGLLAESAARSARSEICKQETDNVLKFLSEC